MLHVLNSAFFISACVVFDQGIKDDGSTCIVGHGTCALSLAIYNSRINKMYCHVFMELLYTILSLIEVFTS